MATELEVLRIVRLLEDYYLKARGKALSEDSVRIYIQHLTSVDAKHLDYAAHRWIDTGEPFMPVVAELKKLASQAPYSPQVQDLDTQKIVGYWRAMTALGASMRGELSEVDLYHRHGMALVSAGIKPDPRPTPEEQAEWDKWLAWAESERANWESENVSEPAL